MSDQPFELDMNEVPDWVQPEALVPPTRKAKMIIVKVKDEANKTGTYRWLNTQFNLVDGIDEEGKYKNKAFFVRVCYFANPNSYTKDYFKKKQHLSQLKQLMKAVGATATNTESLIEQLECRELFADIIQKPDKDKDGNARTVNDLLNFSAIGGDIAEG